MLALVASSVLAPVTPAHAAGGAVQSPDGVLWQCHEHNYRYQIELPPGAYGWSADVTISGPDGLEVSTDYLYDDENPTHGTSSFQICSFEMAGRYTVSTDVEWHDYDYNSSSFSLPDAYFKMRDPKTRTSLTAAPRKPRPNAVVKFRVVSKDERPNGYFGTSYASVVLEVKAGNKWKRIGRKSATNQRGVVTLRARYTGGRKAVRARTLGTDSASGSTSRIVKFR